MPEFCKFSSLSKYVNIKLIPYNWLNPSSLVDESKNWSYGQIPLVLVKIDCNQIKSFLLWTSEMDLIPDQVSQDSLSWSVWYQSDFKWNHSLPSLSPKRSLHWPWRNLPCPLIGKLYVIAINVHWNCQSTTQMTTDGLQTGNFYLQDVHPDMGADISNIVNLAELYKVQIVQKKVRWSDFSDQSPKFLSLGLWSEVRSSELFLNYLNFIQLWIKVAWI